LIHRRPPSLRPEAQHPRGRFRRRICAALVVAAAALATVASPALAHTRSYSYSLWQLDRSPPVVTVRLRQYELTRMHLHPRYTGDYDRRVGELVADGLGLRVDGESCRLEELRADPAADGWVVVRGRPACANPPSAWRDVEITSDLLLDQVSGHLHFATVHAPDKRVAERALTDSSRTWKLALASPDGDTGSAMAPTNLAAFWMLGVEHILGGMDHLAFVVGLLLLAGTVAELGWLITGFTVAHSITLALSALGRVHPVGSAVDALIGLSIVVVAAEGAWEKRGRPWSIPCTAAAALVATAALGAPGIPATALLGIAVFVLCYFGLLASTARPQRWRLLIAFAFGLFHGVGFAGVLAEMALPESRLLSALFGFNLGVEAGQLLIVVTLWPALVLARRHMPVEALATASIAAAGTYWFVVRVFA
jgi:hypothetical protein